MPREDVFLPVATKMMISVTKIISVTEIVSVNEVISVPEIVSVPEVASGVSLVPHAGDGWISVIRESWEAIRLISLVDSCSGVWPGMCKCCPTRIDRRLAKPSGPIRTHSKRRITLSRIRHPSAEVARRH
jgi:hypothetical protein